MFTVTPLPENPARTAARVTDSPGWRPGLLARAGTTLNHRGTCVLTIVKRCPGPRIGLREAGARYIRGTSQAGGGH
jgi:hypothetical protein